MKLEHIFLVFFIISSIIIEGESFILKKMIEKPEIHQKVSLRNKYNLHTIGSDLQFTVVKRLDYEKSTSAKKKSRSRKYRFVPSLLASNVMFLMVFDVCIFIRLMEQI
ncbi:hypothetical protein GCK72_022837 [Caenorhabditis remanei]|uniref:Uncharacterized protein n=1 Tax=Caenorhabditis remanei TaxID=31234 RepID=A0A6A5FV11_CAERE|nr:hypothetical protein GCK72_022837 [Caenorhabditis remanei]KAF1746383.1 hypothetical protein GCK72_022837 [Caenorhabditis remanei]